MFSITETHTYSQSETMSLSVKQAGNLGKAASSVEQTVMQEECPKRDVSAAHWLIPVHAKRGSPLLRIIYNAGRPTLTGIVNVRLVDRLHPSRYMNHTDKIPCDLHI